jgi:hypothetical protein
MFQTRFQQRTGVAEEHFVEHLLPLALYPHARLLRWILPRRVFLRDRDFLASAGRARTRRLIAGECNDFISDLGQQPLWKRLLRLRVSTSRVLQVAWSVWDSR